MKTIAAMFFIFSDHFGIGIPLISGKSSRPFHTTQAVTIGLNA